MFTTHFQSQLWGASIKCNYKLCILDLALKHKSKASNQTKNNFNDLSEWEKPSNLSLVLKCQSQSHFNTHTCTTEYN